MAVKGLIVNKGIYLIIGFQLQGICQPYIYANLSDLVVVGCVCHTLKHVTTISPWMEQPHAKTVLLELARPQSEPSEAPQLQEWKGQRSWTCAVVHKQGHAVHRHRWQRHSVHRHTANKDILCTDTMTETLNTLTHSWQETGIPRVTHLMIYNYNIILSYQHQKKKIKKKKNHLPLALWVLLKRFFSKAFCSLAVGKVSS